MKKYIFLALLTMGVSSCQLVDVLDQKPEFEADLDGAITTPAAVELALNGIYYSLPGNGFNVIFPTVSGSFKAGTMWRQEIVSAGMPFTTPSECCLPYHSVMQRNGTQITL